MVRIADMQNEPNRQQDAPAAGPTPAAPTARPSRRVLQGLGVAALLLGALAVGYALIRQAPTNGYALPLPGDDDKLPPAMRSWAKPDLVLVISGQMHGYVGPCGCSEPQYGGLVRRYNLVELLRRRGWPVVGIDLGELPQTSGLHQQGLLKYQLSMRALDLMGYRAVGLGKHEMLMPLTDALIHYSAENARPRPLALNLAGTSRKGDLYYDLNVRPWEVIAETNPKLGVLSMIGPDLEGELKKQGLKFVSNKQQLPLALQAFADQGVEMGVLLYHEYPDVPGQGTQKFKAIEAQRHAKAGRCVKFCADQRRANPKAPPIALVLSLTEESEPPSLMMKLPGTSAHLIEIGHKGRYVGVVGVYRKGAGIDLKYQLVQIGPEFDAPSAAAKAKNPVMGLMEEYAKQLKRENLLAHVPRTPHQTQIETPLRQKVESHFVGSEACRKCHRQEYAIWKQTPHAHAFETLEKAKFPSNRQFDAECVVCHTVGFKNPTGYYDPPAAKGLKKSDPAKYAQLMVEHNKRLENVGCESCHGPASAHVARPRDTTLYPLINPYRPGAAERKAWDQAEAGNAQAKVQANQLFRKRMDQLDFNFCQKCHDLENAVHWTKDDFIATKWFGKRPVAHSSWGRSTQPAAQGTAPAGPSVAAPQGGAAPRP